MVDSKSIDTLIKLGFSDKGDVFERKVFGEMATIIIEFKYHSNALKEITIKATSEWSDFKLESFGTDFKKCLEKYDEMAYHYETQYAQYLHDLKKGRGFPDRTICPDQLIKSEEL